MTLLVELRANCVIKTDLLVSDPDWIPHGIDIKSGIAHFLRFPASAFAGEGFLADYTPETALDTATISLDELAAMQPEAGPLHFIFHTAFCRSTLLARVMNIDGVATGMSEPGIIASLASAGNAGAHLIEPCLKLLSRRRTGPDGAVQAVFVKPTNHANSLIPALMHAAPDAKAVMLSNSLSAFLRSVNRKGLLGRRWARNLYLEVQSYAPLDLGISPQEHFLLSDLQIAGLAWLLQRRWFEANMKGTNGLRMRSLDSAHFNDARSASLRAIAQFTGLDIATAQIDRAVRSEIFQTHAKLGGNYDLRKKLASADSSSPVFREESAMVEQWIGQIAQQAQVGANGSFESRSLI
ncbi:hypothetical protein GRI44_01420 [Altererythrobacter confluentis]|uniref:Uncharacterized protein n=1 Tax=Allopontixanthobacter confluentis TaxID=1849021 RepID=A0A6L7GBR8_9SPHN|nr:hypothetical protein [Allopontixanthobacter confluentis]MXP13413.1 hypothetical protein [Allopontixanthobacter confluentis]